jgi:hypothetical protein
MDGFASVSRVARVGEEGITIALKRASKRSFIYELKAGRTRGQ